MAISFEITTAEDKAKQLRRFKCCYTGRVFLQDRYLGLHTLPAKAETLISPKAVSNSNKNPLSQSLDSAATNTHPDSNPKGK